MQYFNTEQQFIWAMIHCVQTRQLFKNECMVTVPNLPSDHPIHPPRKEVSPWKIDFPENCGYKVTMVDGVFQVWPLIKHSTTDKLLVEPRFC